MYSNTKAINDHARRVSFSVAKIAVTGRILPPWFRRIVWLALRRVFHSRQSWLLRCSSYAWYTTACVLLSSQSVCGTKGFPTKYKNWTIAGLFIVINQVILPVLVIRVNWRPFLFCRNVTIDTRADAACNVVAECTDYSFLLPLAVAGIELASLALFREYSKRW